MRKICGLLAVAGLAATAMAEPVAQGPVSTNPWNYSPRDTIVDQPWDGASPGSVAQYFGDFAAYSTEELDDFSTSVAYNVTTFTCPGVEAGGGGGLNTAVTAVIRASANATAPPVMTSISGSEDPFGVLTCDFGGQNLPPGNYWISAFVTRNFGGGGGQWFWNQTTPVTGSEEFFHNPGGGFGFGGAPIPGSVVFGVPRDQAFTLQGDLAGGCTWTPPCYADYDGDGFITGDDATLYVSDFESGNMCADVDGDGFLTGDDYTLWVTQFETGC